MSEKENKDELKEDLKKQEVETDVVEENTSYSYGDLTIICQKCGKEQVMDTNIPNGIQLNLLTNHKSMLNLKCDACDSHMVLKFKPSETPPEEEPETMTKHEVTKEDVENNEGEDLKEGDEIEIPKDASTNEEEVIDENVQEESNKG